MNAQDMFVTNMVVQIVGFAGVILAIVFTRGGDN